MELKIYNPQEDGFLREIDWNFEELKQEITLKAETYKNLVYSDSQMKEAKKDRANLRKFITALEGKRKEIKKQVMIPYTAFEKQEKELVAIVDQAVSNIDLQVKGYEEGLRQEKEQKVKGIYEELIGDREFPEYERLFRPEFLNASTTLKSIREEMEEIIQRTDQELQIIENENSSYKFEMKETYYRTMSLNDAMETKQRLEETEKRKQEYEAQKAQEQALKPQTTESMPPVTEQQEHEPVKPEKERTLAITFRVVATASQFEYVNAALSLLGKRSTSLEILNKEEL